MIHFLNVTLDIKISNEPSDGYKDSFSKKNSLNYYEICLSSNWDIPVLVHELWHIFMDCLTNFDDGDILPQDLEKDIYAYSFEKLLRDSLEEIEKESIDGVH